MQSIYRWPAQTFFFSILLSFSRDFPAAESSNWTQLPFDAEYSRRAGSVVANNPERLGKSLSAEKAQDRI